MFNLYKSLPLVIFILLFIVGCVSVPARMQLVNGGHQKIDESIIFECEAEKIRQSLKNVDEPLLQLNPDNISILNWNIYKSQRENWKSDFREFIETEDLLILQEATASPELKGLLNKRHANWNLNNAFHYQGNETGVLTASAIKPAFSCGIRTTEPVIRIPKTVLINLYPLANSDKKLLVVNLHGINFTLGTETYQNQIDSMVSMVELHAGPTIVAGDFNTWSEQRMRIVTDMAEKLSLQAVEYNAHNRVRVFGNALDHVYYRGLEVMSENIRKVSSSDHNPIKVSFRVTEQRYVKL